MDLGSVLTYEGMKIIKSYLPCVMECLGNQETSYVAAFDPVQYWVKNALLVANAWPLRLVITTSLHLEMLRSIMEKLARFQKITLASNQDDRTGIAKHYCISEILF